MIRLFVALVALMFLPGCPEFISCEIGKLPKTEQSILTDVVAIATAGGAGCQSDLEGLGVSVGVDAVGCAVNALVSYWSSPRAAIAPDRREAIDRLRQYQSAHPLKRACGPSPLVG